MSANAEHHNRRPSASRRRHSSRLLVAFVLLALAPAASGQIVPAEGQPAGASAFQNPPLLYQGPDPTADYFLPAMPASVRSATLFPLPPLAEQNADAFTPFGEPTSEQLVLPDETFAPWVGGPRPISDHKDGFFQKLSVSATWLDRGDQASGFGITEVELFAMFALPLPTREWPLAISPTFTVRYLDGPDSPNLPPRLYETYVDFIWLPRFSPRWSAILSVAPSLYSDFVVDDADAFRLTGRGLARFDWIPEQLQLLFGVLYLNRQDVRVLPAGGVIWCPSEDRRYELVFPRPKLAHRIESGPRFEDWLYLGSEFGGNSFAFDRDGVPDIVTLRDYRIYLGLERKFDGGAGYRIEIGYVMSRSAKFASGLPDADAPGTAHLRIGASL